MIFKGLEAKRVTRLLLRYLTEVIIIFSGITCSFLFDQWREENREKKELIELSKSLLTDIEALKGKLQGDLFGSNQWITQLDSLRKQRALNKFSDRQLLWFYKAVSGQVFFLFDPYSPTYMSALGKGSVNGLPEDIRNKLYKLYRIQLPFFQLLYDQQQENITNFRNTTVTLMNTDLYSSQDADIKPDMQVLANEILRPVYGNFINQVIATEKSVYKLNEDSFKTLLELESSLKDYVAKNED